MTLHTVRGPSFVEAACKSVTFYRQPPFLSLYGSNHSCRIHKKLLQNFLCILRSYSFHAMYFAFFISIISKMAEIHKNKIHIDKIDIILYNANMLLECTL